MEAPKCRTCGERHWSRICDEPRNAPVTKGVTVTPNVTPDVTPPVTRLNPSLIAYADAEIRGEHQRRFGILPEAVRVGLLQDEIINSQAEVARLKRALAEANGGGKAMTASERMKKMRERRRGEAS